MKTFFARMKKERERKSDDYVKEYLTGHQAGKHFFCKV